MVARGDVNVVVASFSILANRLSVVDFLAPIANDRKVSRIFSIVTEYTQRCNNNNNNNNNKKKKKKNNNTNNNDNNNNTNNNNNNNNNNKFLYNYIYQCLALPTMDFPH